MTEQTARATKKALKLKRRLKQKKPNFVRPESWRYVRIKENWRRPRGLDHKVRLKYAGWPPGVSIGYRTPKAIRGLHPSGYKELLVHNVEELQKIDPKTQAARIAHTVGKRKRARILAEAKKKKITILNVKEIKEVKEIKDAEETPAEEKESAEEKLEEKEEIEETEKPKQKQAKTRKRKKETGEQ
jgi:large subunit ribosomal protein L32e